MFLQGGVQQVYMGEGHPSDVGFFQHTKGWLCYAQLFQQTEDLCSWKATNIRAMSMLDF